MEGSGYPDLESVRVRKVNSEKPLRISSPWRSTHLQNIFFYCRRDHLVYLASLAHQVLLALLVPQQQPQVLVLEQLAPQEKMVPLVSL